MPTALHPITLGEITGFIIADDVEPLTTERFNSIFNHPDDDAIRTQFAQLANPQFSFNCMLLKTSDRHILIDTGEGLHPGRPHGHLLDGLKQLSVRSHQIDLVILTHFHIDHIGGLTDADGHLVFPKAQVIAARDEWNYWMDPAKIASLDDFRAQTLTRGLQPYEAAGRLTLLDLHAETIIAPHLSLIPLPGHTPGHTGVLIESRGERLLHIADAAHVPLQLKYLSSIPRFDVEPGKAASTRRSVFERAAAQQLKVAAYHFPFPGIGSVTKSAGELRWNPCP